MSVEQFPSLANHFLIAMPELKDPNFSRTVTLICQHDANGALGIVINRTVENLTIGDVLEQFELPRDQQHPVVQQPIFVGGPVQTELGLVLHESLGHWQSTLTVGDQLGLTSSRDVLESIACGTGPNSCLMALGYAGWGAGQLDMEMQKNAWLSVAADHTILFDTAPEARWSEAAQQIGIDLTRLARDVGHA